ncbi:MAG: hypothetical protein IJO29_00240 [Oscillospiraceae bacterium]|nr:hypothetical protein [Oscillospiraceae bacterium]
MTKLEIEFLQAYLYNMHCRLESEYLHLQRSLQLRRADSIDAVEFLIAYERFNMFCEVYADISHILRLYDRDVKKRDLLDGKKQV